jgi:hypothetical protein
MTSLLQVVFQLRLLNGEFVGTLRLSMRNNSSLMHHILHSALLHDTSDDCSYFTAEPFNFFLDIASNPQPIHPLVTDNQVYQAYNIPSTRKVLPTLLQSLELSQNETSDLYAIVVWIGRKISTKTPSTLTSKPNTVYILTFHIHPNHDPEPPNRIGFTTPSGQSKLASYLSFILLGQANRSVHITKQPQAVVLGALSNRQFIEYMRGGPSHMPPPPLTS